MPAKKAATTPVTEDAIDIDTLLDSVQDEKVDPIKEKQALLTRIKELEAQLESNEIEAKKLSEEEKKVSELERQIQDRQNEQAIVAGSFEELNDGDTLLFHVMYSGTSAFGRSWDRGDEIELVVGSESFNSAKKWLPYVFDTDRQIMEWGRVKYELGPWPADTVFNVPAGATELEREMYKVAAQNLREKKRKV